MHSYPILPEISFYVFLLGRLDFFWELNYVEIKFICASYTLYNSVSNEDVIHILIKINETIILNVTGIYHMLNINVIQILIA